MQRSSIKVIGRFKKRRGGIATARGFLELVVRLRGGKPFIPRVCTAFHRMKRVTRGR